MLTSRVDRILSPTIYKLILIVLLVPMLVPYIHAMYSGYIKYALMFGVITCLWYLFRLDIKSHIKEISSIFLLLFVLFYGVTIVVNHDNCFTDNIKQYVYMITFSFLFFFVYRLKEIKTVEQEMEIVSYFLAGITFVASLLSLLTCLLENPKVYYFEEGAAYGTSIRTYYVVGYMDGRLHGIFNPNATAMISAISILVSIFLIFKIFKKNSKQSTKIVGCMLLTVNVVVQFLCLILTKSRGALLGLIATCLFIIALLVIKKSKHKKAIFASIVAVGVALIVGLLSIFGSKLTKTNFTSGRIYLWRAGLEALKESPIFGLTREGFVKPVNDIYYELYGESTVDVIHSGLHNIYLTVLLSAGFIGFVLFITLIVFVLSKSIIVMLKSPINMHMLFSFAMSLLFLIVEFVESRILYQVNIFNIVFWIYFGYLNHFSYKYSEIKESK